ENINIDSARRRRAARAQRRPEMGRCGNFSNGRAAVRMPGRNDGQEIRKCDLETVMSIDNYALFTRVSGSRDHNYSSSGRVGQGGELAVIDWQSRDIEFEIAGYADAGRTERAEALCIVGGTHQAKIKPAQNSLDGLGKVVPAAIGALRHASVDENHRDLALRRTQDDIGPQVGLNEQGEVGMPIVEKPRDETRHVKGDKLMDGAGG